MLILEKEEEKQQKIIKATEDVLVQYEDILCKYDEIHTLSNTSVRNEVYEERQQEVQVRKKKKTFEEALQEGESQKVKKGKTDSQKGKNDSFFEYLSKKVQNQSIFDSKENNLHFLFDFRE